MRPPGTPEERHPGLDAKIVAALDRIGEAFQVLARRAAEAHDLSPTQLRVLARLHAGPPPAARTGALARELDVADPTVSDAVAALRRKGLVDRQQDPDDRRHYRLYLTADGQRISHAVSRWTAPVEVATSRIGRPDGEHLLATLLDVLERMHAEHLISVTRACTTCRHFEPAPRRSRPAVHRCAFFDYRLGPSDIRVDCPEHVTQEEFARHNGAAGGR
ncbi:MarR family winged helix-turn-helix transcriptional regulator [Protofrankia symbiont of Coriaria ruscifolia]|uniref:MarR family transcriptional regulator n=1 Tax=Candidatus Protofrankia californiensis TaxID=1839754 RepID=A0A1C3NYD3_9ACTN|nr:MarR family winged helix-turn-helix transcriptional regulator [Protofrankia symbiont of Coriaria ruscifolia]SBW22541.1 MarR family transcriptional regulator [Candidatus Protofrankia californiensis]